MQVTPWYLLPLSWFIAGTAFTGFFVVGHDCGHRSFHRNKLVEDIVGTLMFAPLIYPFEPWRIKHNQHHAFTNKLVVDTGEAYTRLNHQSTPWRTLAVSRHCALPHCFSVRRLSITKCMAVAVPSTMTPRHLLASPSLPHPCVPLSPPLPAWHPVMPDEIKNWNPVAGAFFKFFLGTPLKYW